MPHISYQINTWQRKVWLSDTRYYQAELKQDLFGEWVLERHWSGRWQKKGRIKTEILSSFDDGILKLEQTHKRRLSHGYHLIESDYHE